MPLVTVWIPNIYRPQNSGVSVMGQTAAEVTVLLIGHVMSQRWLTAGLESGPWPSMEEWMGVRSQASLFSESTEK